MSSFNVNGPSNNLSQIQEAQNMKNNGGGGNLGYMKADGKKKKKKGAEVDPKILEDGSEDKFEHVEEEEEDDDDYYKVDPDDKFEGSKNSSKEEDDDEDEEDDDEDEEQESVYRVENKVKDAFSGLVNRVKSGVDKVKSRQNKSNIFHGADEIQAPEVDLEKKKDELDFDFDSNDDDNPPSGGFLSLSNKK